MLTRKTYTAQLTVDNSMGLLASQLTGAVIELHLELTAPATTFDGISGSVAVTGRVSSVSGPPGADLLLQALGLFGKKQAAFSGKWALDGAQQRTLISGSEQADFELVTSTASGMASIGISLVADVLNKTYSWLVDGVRVSGTAQCTATVEVPDAPTQPGGGGGDWAPRVDDGLIRGYMGSDLLADKNLELRLPELKRLRSAFTHLLVTADLQAPKDGQAPSSWMRPYVGHARNRIALTDLGKRNIALLHALGFKIHLILFNTWALKHGYSENLGSTGGRDGITEDNFANEQLPFEKQFVESLMADPETRNLDGIMPCLEASTHASGVFCRAVAQILKESGYTGKIVANVVADAKQEAGALKAMGVLIASSLNSHSEWVSSENDIRNSDGMVAATPSDTALLSKLVASPGPKGYYIWVAGTVGNNNGRGSWPDNMLLALGANKASSGGGDGGGTPNPPVPGENAEQRSKRLYPGVGLGKPGEGGNYDSAGRLLPTDNTTIWKPKSDSKGRVVIVVGHSMPRIRKIMITRNGSVLETITKIRSIGNGWRTNFDGGQAGGAYGNPVVLVISTDAGDVRVNIPNSSQRYEVRLAPPNGSAPPVVTPPATDPTRGALFSTTPNALTLRADFAAGVGRIDCLTKIIDTHGQPGGSSIAVQAVRSGNTWTIPQALDSYPRGNVPNTWRIRLTRTPPKPATMHTSIMQSFIRVGDNPYGPGNKTYPPTTRP